MIELKQCSVLGMEENRQFMALLEEYSEECYIYGMPKPQAKMEMYKQLDVAKKIHLICAFYEDLLVGFINVFYMDNPHYNSTIAVSESFFVSKQYRKTGAGTKLRIAAELLAKELGSPGLIISSPYEGPLSVILPRSGYRGISTAYYRGF